MKRFLEFILLVHELEEFLIDRLLFACRILFLVHQLFSFGISFSIYDPIIAVRNKSIDTISHMSNKPAVESRSILGYLSTAVESMMSCVNVIMFSISLRLISGFLFLLLTSRYNRIPEGHQQISITWDLSTCHLVSRSLIIF